MPENNASSLPPRPSRTEAPQLTTVSPVDFNDRGGPPITSTTSTSSKPSLMDDYRLDLTKRSPKPPEAKSSPESHPSTEAPASPPAKSNEPHASATLGVPSSPANVASPGEQRRGVSAFTACFIVTVVWIAWRRNRKSAKKIDNRR